MRGQFVPATSLSLYTLALSHCTQGRKKILLLLYLFCTQMVCSVSNKPDFFLCISLPALIFSRQGPFQHRGRARSRLSTCNSLKCPSPPQGPPAGPVLSSPTLKSGSASGYCLSPDQNRPGEMSQGKYLPNAPWSV